MAASDVQRSTQNCPACSASIDVSSAPPLARVACPHCGEKVRVERAFDNFVLLETLGVGGMGSVYKARDTRLDRLVALKLLRSELSADPVEAARLEQEARLTAAINHPHVVQVFSTGYDHGQFYIVMELVEHGSLDDLMAQHTRIPEPQALEIGIQIAQGLRAAQQKGLIHRDIKPANILFSDEHTAKIGDFGLAVAAEQTAEARTEIWGTPYYVAPERLNNAPEDFRSDLYSLGATLFHAIAGRPPIAGETNSAAALRELKNKPLDLRDVTPATSRATARIIMRMIAPDPRMRFQSYSDVIDQLKRARAALEPGAARARRKSIAIGAVVVVLAAAAAVFAIRAKKAPPPTVAGNASNDATLTRLYEDARRELLSGRTDTAYKDFAKLAEQAKDHHPLLEWIRIQRALASLLLQYTNKAPEEFRQLANAPPFASKGNDAALAQFFKTSGQIMSTPAVVNASAVPELPNTPAQPFALFLFAVKDWQQSDFANAARLFEQFTRSQASGAFAWINDYKPLAQKYLAEYQSYTGWKNSATKLDTPEQITKSLVAVQQLGNKLQTRDPLKDELDNEEGKLRRLFDAKQAEIAAGREQQNKQLLERETPLWDSMLAKYRIAMQAQDFSGALAAVTSTQFQQSDLKAKQQALMKRAQSLVDWKRDLMDAISHRGFDGKIVDSAGVPYNGIASATGDRFGMKAGPYGTVQIPWAKFTPATLLAISTALIPANAPDAADREWRCAIFAAATGQPDAAKKLGEAAAEAKPEYREQLNLLNSEDARP